MLATHASIPFEVTISIRAYCTILANELRFAVRFAVGVGLRYAFIPGPWPVRQITDACRLPFIDNGKVLVGLWPGVRKPEPSASLLPADVTTVDDHTTLIA